ncbi:MAG: hypothetical protein SV253_09095 [Halobacteria archaeon]|nr:hypothetical protein [Halobacteria archaeon]
MDELADNDMLHDINMLSLGEVSLVEQGNYSTTYLHISKDLVSRYGERLEKAELIEDRENERLIIDIPKEVEVEDE